MDEEFETTPNSSQGWLIEVRWDDCCNQSEQHRQLCFHVQHAWIQGDMGPELLSVQRRWPADGCPKRVCRIQATKFWALGHGPWDWLGQAQRICIVFIFYGTLDFILSPQLFKSGSIMGEETLSEAHCQKCYTLCGLSQCWNLPNMPEFTSFIGYNLADLLIACSMKY